MEKELQDLFDSHGGILKTGELLQKGYYHRKLQELINDGEIEQVRRGYYQCIDDNSYSEVAIIARLFQDAVICMESALDYYGYTERTPSAWNLAVPDNSSRRRFIFHGRSLSRILSVKVNFLSGLRKQKLRDKGADL